MSSFEIDNNNDNNVSGGSIPLASLRACLVDLKQPIAKRTHAAFHLRTMNTNDAALAVLEALKQKEDSALMRHELAYILGQMQNPIACNILSSILEDEDDDVIVRHESAEALGAIGHISSLNILEKYSNHNAPEISETCRIAIDLVKWRQKGETSDKSYYLSVDPAPPLSKDVSIKELTDNLNDTNLSLFQRYRAMFALRDKNNDEATLALLTGFNDNSALFRHEIAYVLGQMQRQNTIEGLYNVLKNKKEHSMVRHEAAEALGAIGGSYVQSMLEEFKDDDEVVVLQSCEVALDTMDYWENSV